jgi:hypothetical protein
MVVNQPDPDNAADTRFEPGAAGSHLRATYGQLQISLQAALTYNYYATKPNSSFLKLLEESKFDGIGGTSTETGTISLPGGIDFSVSITPLPTVAGSSSHWTVQAPTGTSYYSAFATYPIASNAPGIYSGVGAYYTNLFGILKHEGAKLDASDLNSIYSPSYFNDGNNSSVQSEFDATQWRQLKISQFSIGTIQSLQNDTPVTGSTVISAEVERFATDQGVQCTDECCVSLVCNSEGVCLDYGNQRIARLDLRFYYEVVEFAPTNYTYLDATGFAPSGTLSSLSIDDLSGIYTSAPIPFLETRQVNVKPLHTGPTTQLPYDYYGLQTDITAPVPSTDRFTVTPIPTTGTSPTATLFPPSSTSEPFNLTAGPEALDDFLGKKVKLGWTLPLSMLVIGQSVSGDECTTDQTQKLFSSPSLTSPSAIKATLKFDKTLAGEPITGVDYRISERSLGGLNSEYRFALGTSCSF